MTAEEARKKAKVGLLKFCVDLIKSACGRGHHSCMVKCTMVTETQVAEVVATLEKRKFRVIIGKARDNSIPLLISWYENFAVEEET